MWKAKTLSMGRRLTLIKSVLSSLPIYYLSLFKAPVKVLDHLERLMRTFLWSGSEDIRKIHWVSWEVVTSPKTEGGLGISRLEDVNLALLAKWVWRFTVEQGSMWRGVIEAVHGGRGNWCFLPIKRSISGCWKFIVKILEAKRFNGKSMHHLIRGVVGKGDNICFWSDFWLGNTLLKDRWPCLYKLDRGKKCKVNERVTRGSNGLVFTGRWYRFPSSVEELSEFQDLERLLHDAGHHQSLLSDSVDKWNWADKNGSVFSVAGCKDLIHEGNYTGQRFKLKWESWVPIKVNFIAWRAKGLN